MNINQEMLILAGGSHWTLEAVFQHVKGMLSVESGKYHIGENKGKKDMLDVIKVSFDNTIISFEQVMDIFFTTHNPTIVDWEENCMFPEFRSAVLTYSADQNGKIAHFLLNMEESQRFEKKVHTKILKANDARFTPTDAKYINYYNQYPKDAFSISNIEPKIEKVRNQFPKLLKKSPQ